MVTVLEKQEVCSDDRIVNTVRVVVHNYGPEIKNRSWNHWSIYLILANGNGSVRSNMRAESEGYNNGLLEWSDCGYIQSSSNISHWDFPCKANTKVQDIAKVIYDKGRERYDLVGGEGCRYWIYVVVKDLADTGIINARASDEIWARLVYLYHATDAPISLGVVQGKFY